MRKKQKRLVALLLSLLMVISLLPTTGLTVEAATKPKLAKKSSSIVIGGTSKIKVKNVSKGAKITYKSANKSIATVSKQGNIKGIRSGTTKITVSVKKNSKTTKLTYKVTVKKPKLSKSKLSLIFGQTAKLSIKNKPKNAKYTWQSSNPKVATVNKNGNIVTKAKGTTTIKAEVKTAKKTYNLSCKVTVKYPDWYFLFAIFKNVDADGKDGNGNAIHAKYSMPQDEIDTIRDHAQAFEDYMNQLGVMSAHVEVVEIDATVTKLQDSEYGAWLGFDGATLLLENKVDLDKYDHTFGIVSLNVSTRYAGLTGSAFENGTGYSCIHFRNRENCLEQYPQNNVYWTPTLYVHEFLHFTEALSRKFEINFNEHAIQKIYDSQFIDGWKDCYTDIILNRVNGNTETGTGVPPIVWQYPPHELRTLRELTIPNNITVIGQAAFIKLTDLENLTIPSNVSSIGKWAFQDCSALSKVNIHSGVITIGDAAFERCTALTELTIPSSVTSIGEWAFQGCSALNKISIPSSVTSIGQVAFYHTGLKDVYYSGTKAQWKTIQIGEHNEALTEANIHYNSKDINNNNNNNNK